jgi:hypothetical protein
MGDCGQGPAAEHGMARDAQQAQCNNRRRLHEH